MARLRGAPKMLQIEDDDRKRVLYCLVLGLEEYSDRDVLSASLNSLDVTPGDVISHIPRT